MTVNDRALCSVLTILSGSSLVPEIIPKCNLGIPICQGNTLGTSLSDSLHIISPGLGVYNPMRCLERSLVGIVQLLEMLVDARINICPALGLHMRCQVKLGLQSYIQRTSRYVPYEAFTCPCGSGDVVLRESYKPKTRGKLYYACPRLRLLVGSPRASTTPIHSPGSSSTPIYSPGASTTQIYSPRSSSTLIYSPGASTTPIYSRGSSSTPIYSPGASRNAKCSNCKHLLDKITVLVATVDMYMHLEQHTVNSAALFHKVYNNMGKLDL
ncbi:hypothetical protein Tco_1470593 [Tanacetum coccineum]